MKKFVGSVLPYIVLAINAVMVVVAYIEFGPLVGGMLLLLILQILHAFVAIGKTVMKLEELGAILSNYFDHVAETSAERNSLAEIQGDLLKALLVARTLAGVTGEETDSPKKTLN